MAMGRSHDRATGLLALPFGLLWAPWLGSAGVGCAAAGFLLGGLLLSPDLDTRSNCSQRWGALRLLWWPYRHCLSHRSLLSHSPLLGSAGRLAYLAGIVLLAATALESLGLPALTWLRAHLPGLWQEHRPLLISALAGVEASSWLHLIQDGDPMPRLPRPLRHRRTRRRGRRP
ncbi:MAG: DUF2227 family putative metal-binding protein [Cyanobium sp.]